MGVGAALIQPQGQKDETRVWMWQSGPGAASKFADATDSAAPVVGHGALLVQAMQHTAKVFQQEPPAVSQYSCL